MSIDTVPLMSDPTLHRYVIASADMYHAEVEQRDVFLSCDEQGNFRIWGEITNESPSTTIDLFEIFLVLYCGSWSCAEESLYHMHDFGECLGRALAKYIKSAIPPSISKNMAVQALKHILKTMDGYPSIENGGNEVRFTVPDFPLEKAAEHCGLRNTATAVAERVAGHHVSGVQICSAWASAFFEVQQCLSLVARDGSFVCTFIDFDRLSGSSNNGRGLSKNNRIWH